jgi:hypothetical protein
MHFLLYVCLPTDEARTSLQARRRVCRYLNEEHFVHSGRFCGFCDYFSVGGRFSGMLNMLRLKQYHPRVFKKFLTQYQDVSEAEAGYELFRRCFPKYDGMNPLCRSKVRFYGYPDDAQIMDEVLFAELKDGFNEDISFAHCFKKPNLIFTDLCEDEWPADPTSGVGRHWVVVIDYHE